MVPLHCELSYGSKCMRVTLYPAPPSAHIAQIVTGLVALEAHGSIRVAVAGESPLPKEMRLQHHLWADLHVAGERRRVCFDMLDGVDVDEAVVRAADVYFKRGYTPQVHAALKWQTATIRPYGLNYECVADSRRFRTLWGALVGGEGRRAGAAASLMNRLGARWWHRQHRQLDFEVGAHVPAARRVMFSTRLWSRAQVPAMDPCVLERLNRARVETVRALRHAFGERFTGGLVDNAEARCLAPDLIAPDDTTRAAFLARMQQHLVCVTTTGLHGSTGWKFAEYMAASRCIVSEPLLHTAMVPVEADVHYLSAVSPDDCVAACDRLLRDAVLAEDMRRANARYYADHLRPDRLVQQCLSRAMEL